MSKQTYPMISFLVRYGSSAALGVAVVVLLGCLLSAVITGNWLYAPAGLVGGPVIYVLLKSYVELVAVMADMLLPK